MISHSLGAPARTLVFGTSEIASLIADYVQTSRDDLLNLLCVNRPLLEILAPRIWRRLAKKTIAVRRMRKPIKVSLADLLDLMQPVTTWRFQLYAGQLDLLEITAVDLMEHGKLLTSFEQLRELKIIAPDYGEEEEEIDVDQRRKQHMCAQVLKLYIPNTVKHICAGSTHALKIIAKAVKLGMEIKFDLSSTAQELELSAASPARIFHNLLTHEPGACKLTAMHINFNRGTFGCEEGDTFYMIELVKALVSNTTVTSASFRATHSTRRWLFDMEHAQIDNIDGIDRMENNTLETLYLGYSICGSGIFLGCFKALKKLCIQVMYGGFFAYPESSPTGPLTNLQELHVECSLNSALFNVQLLKCAPRLEKFVLTGLDHGAYGNPHLQQMFMDIGAAAARLQVFVFEPEDINFVSFRALAGLGASCQELKHINFVKTRRIYGHFNEVDYVPYYMPHLQLLEFVEFQDTEVLFPRLQTINPMVVFHEGDDHSLVCGYLTRHFPSITHEVCSECHTRGGWEHPPDHQRFIVQAHRQIQKDLSAAVLD